MNQELRVSSGKSLFLFICWWILSTVLASVIIGYIGTSTVSSMRWATLVQDIFMFTLPVVLTMLLVARHPMGFVGLSCRLRPSLFLCVAVVAFVSIPAMNRLVAWNDGLHLPASMAGLEEMLRGSENRARAAVEMLMGGTTVWDLILGVLLMGCLTGFVEELFFRGALQQLLRHQLGGNPHVAIWATAAIFSAVHLQFFGFFPRLLMGAFFGYLLYWSGSLRLPIFAHALNNSLVVINFWLQNRSGHAISDADTIGVDNSVTGIVLLLFSLAATSFVVYYIAKIGKLQNQSNFLR